MTLATRGRVVRTLPAAAPPAIIALVATILLLFPPENYSFYPRCPIHEYLHLQCPGCGATRALAALLRGHVAEALQLNPLIPLLLPLVLLYLTHHLWKQRHNIQALTWPNPPRYAVYALLVVAAVFTIARNLPS
jgi:Protein of unknown function (DUF2752)